MKTTVKLLTGTTIFYLLTAILYGYFTSQYQRANNTVPPDQDPAAGNGIEVFGFVALLVVAVFTGMLAVYFWMLGRRLGSQFPADQPEGQIEENAGEQGFFSPWSWWPLLLGAGVAIITLGLALGWWIVGVGAIPTVIGLIGWVYQYNNGDFAH